MFANWFRSRKAELGLTYEEIAKELELQGYKATKQSVSMWARGERNPSLHDAGKIEALAKILMVSETDILSHLGYGNITEDVPEANYAAQLIGRMDEKTRRRAIQILEALAN